MARPMNQDFMHNMRFWVSAELVDATGAASGVDPLQVWPGGVVTNTPAGFTNVTTPELSTEAVEYKEGHFIYTQKYPGAPSIGGDITCSRGVAQRDSSFWTWARQTAEGAGEYRADLRIKHFHRNLALTSAISADIPNERFDPVNGSAPRTYNVKQAFPVRMKAASDLDATSSDISVQEIDLAFENFTVTEIPA